MSEIKVGDRVRIVQIIVKCDNSNRFPVARAKHLGREGIVTSTLPLDENSYAVLLSGSSLSNLFYHEELELLSVDNEHEEPSAAQLRNDYDDLKQWYRHLHEQKNELVKVNEWLTTECRELHVMGKRQREENTHLVAKIVELQKKYDGITKPRDMSERLREENVQLHKEVEELTEKYNSMLEVNNEVRAKIVHLVNHDLRAW